MLVIVACTLVAVLCHIGYLYCPVFCSIPLICYKMAFVAFNQFTLTTQLVVAVAVALVVLASILYAHWLQVCRQCDCILQCNIYSANRQNLDSQYVPAH